MSLEKSHSHFKTLTSEEQRKWRAGFYRAVRWEAVQIPLVLGHPNAGDGLCWRCDKLLPNRTWAADVQANMVEAVGLLSVFYWYSSTLSKELKWEQNWYLNVLPRVSHQARETFHCQLSSYFVCVTDWTSLVRLSLSCHLGREGWSFVFLLPLFPWAVEWRPRKIQY